MKHQPDNLSVNDIKMFMENDWHIRPKLFRQAFKHLEPLCDIDTILEMASDENIESRFIQHHQQRYTLQHGPFDTLPNLNTPNWTVLIQGLETVIPEAQDLLQQFRFIPDARLDDIMLSLASDQGGVGPHYDSYDVFLIQMHGKRRWQIGPLSDTSLVPNSPVKILQHFEPNQSFILEPGDMLYLPPNYGHHGEAIGICSTISVGFRAFSKSELLSHLLHDLADQVANDEQLSKQLFSDPQRGISDDCTEIPNDLIEFSQNCLIQFKPDHLTIQKCVGTLLSEPKSNVFFDSSQCENMSPEDIQLTFEKQGLSLALGCRMLFLGNQLFMNGEAIQIESMECLSILKKLAKTHELTANHAKNAFKNPEFRFLIIGFAKSGWLNCID